MLHLNCSACFVPGSPDTGNTICLINEKNILLSSNKCVVGVIGCVVVIEEIILRCDVESSMYNNHKFVSTVPTNICFDCSRKGFLSWKGIFHLNCSICFLHRSNTIYMGNSLSLIEKECSLFQT